MGRAFECERCGDLQPGLPERVVWDREVAAPGGWGNHPPRDGESGWELCESCADAFDAFMGDRPDTDVGPVSAGNARMTEPRDPFASSPSNPERGGDE